MLLHNLAQLLELRVVSKEIEIAKTLLVVTPSGSGGGSSGSLSSRRACASASAGAGAGTTLLCSEVEEVDISIITYRRVASGRGRGSSSLAGRSLLLEVLGNTLG